jgi:type II secretory ATPase GspE/PulE/Tfp pilus assembly ATPase PilB-like protein
LYSIMKILNKPEVNIATIEDPVEYNMDGITQIQVNKKAELTFSTGLRSIVRQDPDIILVGEIRDEETAGIAVNSAMTGHLVLSTLHTNDAATTLPRLLDMGIEPFLVASTVNVAIGQRLVRKICPKCIQSYEVHPEDLETKIPLSVIEKMSHGRELIQIYKGKGCALCHDTGYHGRTGIFEVLEMKDNIRELIMKNANADTIRNTAIKNGMKTMFDDALEKVISGVTTLDEMLRVIRE